MLSPTVKQSFRLDPVSNVREWWRQILPDVKTALERGEGSWPEDVYAALTTGKATLHIGTIREQYVGFAVTMPIPSDAPALMLWIVHNTAGHDILKEGQDALDDWARKQGVKKLIYRADRPSFERLTKTMGYTLDYLQLSRTI